MVLPGVRVIDVGLLSEEGRVRRGEILLQRPSKSAAAIRVSTPSSREVMGSPMRRYQSSRAWGSSSLGSSQGSAESSGQAQAMVGEPAVALGSICTSCMASVSQSSASPALVTAFSGNQDTNRYAGSRPGQPGG